MATTPRRPGQYDFIYCDVLLLNDVSRCTGASTKLGPMAASRKVGYCEQHSRMLLSSAAHLLQLLACDFAHHAGYNELGNTGHWDGDAVQRCVLSGLGEEDLHGTDCGNRLAFDLRPKTYLAWREPAPDGETLCEIGRAHV